MIRSIVALALAVSLAGCGGMARGPTVARPRPTCGDEALWDGATCRSLRPAELLLAEGTAALGQFQVDEALVALERARAAGPLPHAQLAALYAQLGVGHAYLKHDAEALAAFDMLLAIDPSYVIEYTLGPTASFLFEQARSAARAHPAPAIEVSWPRGLDVTEPVPVEIEVVADPKAFLRRAVLHVRRKGEPSYASFDAALAPAGSFARVLLPAPLSARAEVLQLWATAIDDQGNEVLTWADPTRPREVPLHYTPPTPWYRTWWVWAAAGGAIAAGTGATVYLLSQEPPRTVDGSFGARP